MRYLQLLVILMTCFAPLLAQQSLQGRWHFHSEMGVSLPKIRSISTEDFQALRLLRVKDKASYNVSIGISREWLLGQHFGLMLGLNLTALELEQYITQSGIDSAPIATRREFEVAYYTISAGIPMRFRVYPLGGSNRLLLQGELRPTFSIFNDTAAESNPDSQGGGSPFITQEVTTPGNVVNWRAALGWQFDERRESYLSIYYGGSFGNHFEDNLSPSNYRGLAPIFSSRLRTFGLQLGSILR